jgi:cytohesin
LHFAAGGGHKEVAELLIAKGADVNAKVAIWGRTPLHFAAWNGHKEVAELLIAKGANVNARDAGGGTPLDLADNKVTADLLRKHGGKTGEEIADEMAKRSIHVAARVGDIDWVIKHLEAITDVDAKEGGGYTPLLHAAITGHKEIVELLIAKGADVNAKDDDGYTPLLHAALNLDAGIFELLIDNGADVNAKADNGETSLDRAIGLRLTETANLLRKHGGKTGEELKGGAPVAEASQPEPPIAKAPDIPIHTAARDGNTLAVKQHLDAGTDVNTKTAFLGSVPLHYAAHSGYTETAEQLIVSGANVNVMDAGDTTPLDWAIQKKRTETAALLRKHGGKTGAELKAEGK